MTFPILGGNSAVAGAYSIDNSLRFNDGDSARLIRTPSSTSNRRTWTYSAWVKTTNPPSGEQYIWEAQNGTNFNRAGFSNSEIVIGAGTSGVAWNFNLYSYAKHRDPSAWYHIVYAFDTTQATDSNRVKVYVNGSQITDWRIATYPSQNSDWGWNTTSQHNIGANNDSQYGLGGLFDGYLAEIYFVDGQQLSASDFGEYDNNGIWKPLDSEDVTSAITFGTNGFYLDFENSGSLGADSSGNGNNFTPTNLASTDQTTDTPTNNFATLNPLARSNNTTFSEGNTQIYGDASANYSGSHGTIGVNSGKWYCEVKVIDATYPQIGALILNTSSRGDAIGDGSGYGMYYYYENIYWQDNNSAIKVINTSETVTNATVTGGSNSVSNYTTNDIIMMALDMDNGHIWFGKNGTWENSGNPASGTNAFNLPTNYADGNGMTFYGGNDASTLSFNFGNPSFSISSGNSDDNGYGNFEYAPPSGYLALCTQNLATELSPTIDDGSAYFQATTYTGDGTDDRPVTNSGNSDLQPDWIWVKNRSDAFNHILQDTSRGLTTGGYLASNQTQAESGATTVLVKTATSNGFTVGTSGAVNANTDNLVAWQWKANAGSTSSNTDGSITSTVQANTTAGFSIVTYTGNGTSGATIGHGLGVVPNVMIVKMRTDAGLNWEFYHSEVSSTPQNDFLLLNQTSAKQTASNRWNNTAPTSSVFTVGNGGGVNSSGKDYVAYLFNNVNGYFSGGSYTGNGSTDGTFVYTGFRPAFILTKASSRIEDWAIIDNKRDTYNVNFKFLKPNTSEAENTGVNRCDFTSNGFKWRDTNTKFNQSGETYIYMAFAENPFVSSKGVPVTAR